MRNAHPGTCYRCGGNVKTGDGHFEKASRSHMNKWGIKIVGWLLQHSSCAIKYRGTKTHYIYCPDKETDYGVRAT